MDDPVYMTIEETAALLRRPLATLYNWRSRGEGPPSRKIGRGILYKRDEVIAWVDAHAAAGSAA